MNISLKKTLHNSNFIKREKHIIRSTELRITLEAFILVKLLAYSEHDMITIKKWLILRLHINGTTISIQ